MLGKIQEPPGISKNFPLSHRRERGNGAFILENRLKELMRRPENSYSTVQWNPSLAISSIR